MNKLNKIRLQILEETLEYYSKDPKERRCKNNNTCYYSGDIAGRQTDGCAVGRLLKPELRLKLDKEYSLTKKISFVGGLMHELPQNIRDLGFEFLKDLQGFHDADYNWTEDGISKTGKIDYQNIKERINTNCYEN